MDSSNPVKKILILSANPRGTAKLRLDEEVRDIREGLERAKKREQFNLVEKWAVRPRDIQRAILDVEPNIVHFSGHGTGSDGLVLEDNAGQFKFVNSEALAGLFELAAETVECVVLNACYSEEQAVAIVQHIDYVVGMNQAIEDKSAIEFAVGFYDALLAGKTIDVAYKWGCNSLKLAGMPGSSTPILKKKSSEKTRALEEELSSYRELLKLNPLDDLAYRHMASTLEKLGRYQEAAAAYKGALEIKPDNHITWSQQGTALVRLGEFDEAIASYDKAIELEDDDFKVWRKRGLALAESKQYVEAVKSYNRALELQPDASDNYVILTERGTALMKMGQFKASISSYNQALKIKPSYRAAKYGQRWIYKEWSSRLE